MWALRGLYWAGTLRTFPAVCQWFRLLELPSFSCGVSDLLGVFEHFTSQSWKKQGSIKMTKTWNLIWDCPAGLQVPEMTLTALPLLVCWCCKRGPKSSGYLLFTPHFAVFLVWMGGFFWPENKSALNHPPPPKPQNKQKNPSKHFYMTGCLLNTGL